MSQTLKVDLEKLKAKNTPPLEIKVGEYTIKDTGSELVISNSQSNISINEIMDVLRNHSEALKILLNA